MADIIIVEGVKSENVKNIIVKQIENENEFKKLTQEEQEEYLSFMMAKAFGL